MSKTLTRHEKALLASNQFDALRGAGYSASALRDAGYSLSALRGAGYSLSALRGAGYSLSALRDAGYSASDLLGAGYSLSALRDEGYSASDLLGAGYSLSALRDEGYSASDLLDRTPFIELPYTKLLADIREQKRVFKQSTFGPGYQISEPNICRTAMCTAGHLVNMAGDAGWALYKEFNFAGAAALIHEKAHPGWPCQNFSAISDDLALAYIEEMAEHEEKGTSPIAESVGCRQMR